jgi:phage-related protein
VIKKCFAAIGVLEKYGHNLRRPHVDYLRNGIYELRISFRGIQYRMLYFFHGKDIVIISHGLVKESIVPPYDIDLSLERKKKYGKNPEKHTYVKEVDHERG